MTTWFKKGVLGKLHPIAQKGFGRVEWFYASKGLEFFCTSIAEGNHGYGSFHYIDLAFDFKRQGVSIEEIKEVLGDGFQVVEYVEKDIFHVEYDIWN